MLYTENDIEWRESELADAVSFLEKVNPKGYDAYEIKSAAVSAWRESGCNPTFIGTAGWYVTIVRKTYESEKPWIALVSVMAYTAKRGLDEKLAAMAQSAE
jgi:hypothetical protein